MDTLYIKNMVCDRCKMAVENTLLSQHLHPKDIKLGKVTIYEELTPQQRKQLATALGLLGFELLNDKHQQIVEQIKSAIIELVHYHDNAPDLNLSHYLSIKLHTEYSALSKLFKGITGNTIECYYIAQRIERVKELIKNDELSLTQIAVLLNYSSVSYLSNQFKAVTGMTPSQFKTSDKITRKALDKI